MRNVDTFARETGLEEHLSLLRKGALVAQNPSDYESIQGELALSADEKQWLRKETEHKWRVPKLLYLTIVTCSIGAAVQGWDQTGSNAAVLVFPRVYGIDSGSVGDELLVGLINAAPYLSSA